LQNHHLSDGDIDLNQVVQDFLSEMKIGLEGGAGSLRMIPTYIEADNEFMVEVPVVAIDAGGTNFRTAMVRFNSKGELEISELENSKMPGLDRKISKDEFFEIMAGYVKKHAAKADRIGFCFSYPTEIYPNKDGRLLHFSKEVQAPEVIGQLIGKNLLDALGSPSKQIVLLNDTVATLLAGKSASFGKTYDTFIGFILGTGTNTCYNEPNRNITKTRDLDSQKSQIINIESGNFSMAPRTDIDVAFDNTTANPGHYTFEKMISGGYFGGLCLTALKTAAAEGVFSAASASVIASMHELTSEDVSVFASRIQSPANPLRKAFLLASDEQAAVTILEAFIKRAARLVAANLASVVLKTDKGKSPDRPILITVEGTTFYKMHLLKHEFEQAFVNYLSGERKRYCEFTEVAQSSLVGAALAALIN